MKKILSAVLCLALMLGILCMPAYAASADPKLLRTPYDLTVTQMGAEEGQLYGGVVLHFKIDNMPESVDDGTSVNYWLDFEQKIGDGPWEESSYNPVDGYELLPPNNYVETYTWGQDWSNMVLSYRVRMMIYDTSTVSAFTPWSNVATIGIKASPWATEYVQKAMNYGIIPPSISDDFTKPITREEFAELAMRLYEVKTGLKAEAAPDATFSDCSNPDVLKAYKLLIVNGVGNGKFDPKSLTNREQIAAMLYRAVKAIAPTTDLSTAGAPTFSDSSKVSSYFVEDVKYMSKHQFITGSDGKFDPKGTCTREMAVIIAVRVYDAFS